MANLQVTKIAVSGDFVPQGLTIGGKITMMTIDSNQWYLAPATAFQNRNNIVIQNLSVSGGVLLWNYDNISSATSGFQVPQGGSRSLAIQGSIPVYVRMLSGGSTLICIEELA